ncbi:MAG: hypothetical protein Q8O76_10985 [Chloroflexota bacterium]|nr:hypothetical protein [Chloroflexota bacterium]
MYYGLAREAVAERVGWEPVPSAVVRAYRANQVIGANPLRLVLMVYDVAIAAAAKQDLADLTEAVNLLRNALDCDTNPELGGKLLALYGHCQDLARRQEFAEAGKILKELKGAWADSAYLHTQILPGGGL